MKHTRILLPVLLLSCDLNLGHSAPAKNEEPLSVTRYSIEKSLVPIDEEGNHAILYWLVSDSYRIAFRPPSGWTLSGDPEKGQFVMESSGGAGQITFSWLSKASLPSEPLSNPSGRNSGNPQPSVATRIQTSILSQFPEAKQATSHPSNACGVLGETQEWQVKQQSGMTLYLRSTLLPLPEGNIQILMVSSSSSQILHGKYTFFLNSLQFQRDKIQD